MNLLCSFRKSPIANLQCNDCSSLCRLKSCQSYPEQTDLRPFSRKSHSQAGLSHPESKLDPNPLFYSTSSIWVLPCRVVGKCTFKDQGKLIALAAFSKLRVMRASWAKRPKGSEGTFRPFQHLHFSSVGKTWNKNYKGTTQDGI